MSQFDVLRKHRTSASTYPLSTDEIVAKLEMWDAEFGVTVSDVEADRFVLHFKTLPEDLDEFAQDLYAFCPNIIEADFGNYEDLLESLELLPPDYAAHVSRLSEGIDFEDPDYPFQLLKKSLLESKQVALMWD